MRVLAREATFEFIATAFLLIAVVGSGIMAERLCGGNVGLALLANALATGGALVALILAFGPQSGAALATVVGVLVEVPVMLSVCAACNRTRHWFPAGQVS